MGGERNSDQLWGNICRKEENEDRNSLSNKGYVLIHGKKAGILGRVCMDQLMVDVTDIPDVKYGDKITMIGSDGEESLPVEILSGLSGRFNYEFVCNLGKRVPHEFLRHGEVTEQRDYFS